MTPPTWTPVTHCCRQRPKTWPKRLALELRTVLACPKLLSMGSTSSSCMGEGHSSIPLGAAVVPTDQASRPRTLCTWQLCCSTEGSVTPALPVPAVGNASGCPRGEARGLKTTLLAQRSSMVPLGSPGNGELPLTRHPLSLVCPCSRLLRNCTIFLEASVFPEPLCPLQEGEAGRVSRKGHIGQSY